MICAAPPLMDCTCRINFSAITIRTSSKLPPTGTGAGLSNGDSLEFKSTLKSNSPILVLPTLLRKLSTRDWLISNGSSSASNIISCFFVEAHGIPYTSFSYACENVDKYYAGMEHLRGEALKQRLNSIIARHQSLSYKKVWDALKILDAADVDKPEASSEVVKIYSLRAVSKLLAGKPEGWNLEHLWPRSYGLINGPSLTDLHNIRPADVNVISSRGNKFYGECHFSTSYCSKPATRESASDTETDKERWAPPVQQTGRWGCFLHCWNGVK